MRIAILLMVASLVPSGLWAQAVSGTIFGAVRDPSDAAVAGAQVTVRNAQTNFSRSTVTSSEGDYRFPSLPLGSYTVAVEHAGFGQHTQEGITLQVDAQVRVDIVLRVGNVAEKVVVAAEAPLVNTTNAETAEVVERTRIEQLPLNGRNFVQLIQLTTGTNTGAAGDQQSNLVINHFRGSAFFSANGMRTWYNNYMLDGVNNNESAWNSGGIILLPVVDAIQEFKVSTGNFSSEFGRAAGGVVNVQTRAGSNEFHGNLFEFFRNSALDANDFFNNASRAARPPFRQNQFGGTFGGPLRRDKMFFFADYQGTRQSRGTTYLASVPTDAMRLGDFTNTRLGAIFDPATTRAQGAAVTRDPFPGRTIPRARMDAAALRYLELMPRANTGGADAIALNLINNPNWTRQGNQGDIRMDYNLGSRGTLFGRYSVDRAGQNFPNDLTTASNPFGGGGRGNVLDLQAQSAVLNGTYLATSSLVLEGRLGFNRYNFLGLPIGADDPKIESLKLPGSHIAENARSITALAVTGLTAFGPTTGVPNSSIQNLFQWVFNASWTKGRHSLRTGLDARRHQRNNYFISAQPTGQFSFSPNFTSQTGVGGGGVGFASFLLGTPDSINRGVVNGRTGRRNTEWGFYVQDDFKVTSALSLSYGVRYEVYTPWYEVADRMSALDLETGRVVFAGKDNKFGRALRKTDRNNFAPRLGLAWTTGAKLVVRAGYGLSYVEEFGGNGTNPIQNPPGSTTQQLVYSTTAVPTVFFSQGIPIPAPVSVTNATGLYRQIDYKAVAAYAQTWDLSLQREFGQGWLVDAAYVGAKGTHLLEITDPNQAVPGAGAINPRRPLFALAPNVTTAVGASVGNSIYHSFQLKVQKRMSKGFYVLGSYTNSKVIGSVDSNFSNAVPGVASFGQAQNALNRAAERSLSDTDIPQRLVASYGWELPFFPKHKLLGGWHISGITTFSAGNPFDIVNQPSTLNNGGSQRPDRIADGGIDDWTLDRYFDIAAFRAPAPFTYGNSGRNVLRGPGVKTWDVSVIKDSQLNERLKLQWRTDLFNAANTPQFNAPGNTIGTPQAGRISSTRFATNRQIQFVTKLFF